jgi:5-methylcytosine-specific restriction protein A
MTAFVALEFPSWIRWGQRRGADLAYTSERGPNGRALCRWCRVEIPKGRHSWCSVVCVQRFLRVSQWATLAEYVIARDGACRKCGCEHPGWNRSRSLARKEFHAARHGWVENRLAVKDRGYVVEFHVLAEWWEVDHIVPVKDGGTDDPENLRLLCHGCHVAAGIEQRRTRKAKTQIELPALRS